MAKQNNLYFLYGDLINSSALIKTATISKKLNKAIATINANNNEFENLLAVKMNRWKGIDELSCMIKEPQHAAKVIAYLSYVVFPNQYRWVLVKGSINTTTAIHFDTNIANLEGAVFGKAMELMQQLKKEKKYFICNSGNYIVDESFTNQINLLYLIKNSWTEKQRIIFENCKIESQEIAAKKLKITAQAVSKILKSINGAQIIDLEKGMQNWLHIAYNK